MRVWIVEISDFLPTLDGNNRLYRAGMLAQALARAQHDVVWWSSTFNHQLRRHRCDSTRTVSVEPNLRLVLLHGPGYGRSISPGRFRHNIVVANGFAKAVAQYDPASLPDVMHVCLPTLEVGEKAVAFANSHKIPVVVDIRDQWPSIFVRPFPKVLQAPVRLALQPAFSRAKRMLRGATAIIGVSRSNVEWGLRLAERKQGALDRSFPLGFPEIPVHQHDIEDRTAREVRNRHGIPEDCLIVTFAGSFSPTCNFRTVLEAARRLHQINAKVTFLFIGNGAQELLLAGEAKRLPNVRRIDWQERPEVERLLAISSIGLAPYVKKAPQTLPNKPFEYMSAGLPLLSSLTGEMKEMIEAENIGLHYESDDTDDLVEKLTWFAAHDAERAAMGKRAYRVFIERFAEGKVYPALADYLLTLADSKDSEGTRDATVSA